MCPEQSGALTHFLGQGLLQGGQGSVRVGGVGLQGLDSLLQAAHLLFLISKLLLEIFNLSVHTHLRGEKEIKINTNSHNNFTLQTGRSGLSVSVCPTEII